MTADGTFRDDLYWRIRGIEIELRLAERAGDLGVLAQHFQPGPRAGGARARLTGDSCARRSTPGSRQPSELRHSARSSSPAVAARSSSRIYRRVRGARIEKDPGGDTLEAKLAALERRELAAALAATGGNKSQAAQRLGLSRQGLLNKLARHGL
jgi:DNA-binding NtrC family response regulator